MDFFNLNDQLIVQSISFNNVDTFDEFLMTNNSEIMVEIGIYNKDGKRYDDIYNISLQSAITNGYITLLSNENDYVKYNMIDRGILIDSVELLKSYGYTSGHFKVDYKFYYNILGNHEESNKLFIKKISPSNTELIIDYINENVSVDAYGFSKNNFWRYGTKFKFDKFANFGNNVLLNVVNAKNEFDTNNKSNVVILKLYDKLPKTISVKDSFWMIRLITDIIYHDVTLYADAVDELSNVNMLRRPNYNFVNRSNEESDFKNYWEVISDEQSIIDLDSANSNTTELQIYTDYSDYNNFILFSSAAERLENFINKLNLIHKCEYSQSIVSAISSSAISSSNVYWNTLREETLFSFTSYERFLFYESGSNITSSLYPDSIIDCTYPKIYNSPTSSLYVYKQNYYAYGTASVSGSIVDGINTKWTIDGLYPNYAIFGFGTTPSSVTTWYNISEIVSDTQLILSGSVSLSSSNVPFVIYQSETPGVQWYATMSQIAFDYDTKNENYLVYSLPGFIQSDLENNQDYSKFLGIVGEMYDELYPYVKGLEKTSTQSNILGQGPPPNVLWNILSNKGLNISNSHNLVNLSEYKFGLKVSVSSLEKLDKAESKITSEIWNRLLNNYMYIYKTKGTKRSVEALLNCFGISPNMVSIREFGGPRSTNIYENVYSQDMVDFTHMVSFDTGSEYIYVPWTTCDYSNGTNRFPDSIELKFNTFNRQDMILLNMSSSEYVDRGFKLELKHKYDQYGYLKYTLYSPTSSVDITSSVFPYYNGEYYNVMLKRFIESDELIATQSYGLHVIDYDEYLNKIIIDQPLITIVSSSDINLSYCTTGSLYIGGYSGSFIGHMDEFRLWSEYIYNSIFRWHSQYSLAVNGNTLSSSLDNLITRLTFNTPHNLYYTSSVNNEAYHTNYITTASAYGFQSGSLYDSYPYHYVYHERSNTVIHRYITPTSNNSNKVRLEDNYLNQSIVLSGSDLVYPLKSEFYDGIKDENGTSHLIRGEYSEFDGMDKDSDRLIIGFTPSEILNNDIIAFFGNNNILSGIGDYSHALADRYPSIKNLRHLYYDNAPTQISIKTYIEYLQLFDKSVFSLIKDVLPVKSNPIVGIIYEENILHRNKVSIGKDFNDTIIRIPMMSTHMDFIGSSDFLSSSGYLDNLNDILLPIHIKPNVDKSNNLESNTIKVPYIFKSDVTQYDVILNSSDNVILANNIILESKIDNDDIYRISVTNSQLNFDLKFDQFVDIGVDKLTKNVDINIINEYPMLVSLLNYDTIIHKSYNDNIVFDFDNFTTNIYLYEFVDKYKNSEYLWIDSNGDTHTLGRKYDLRNNETVVDRNRYDFSVKKKQYVTFNKSELNRFEYDVTGPTSYTFVSGSKNISTFIRERNIFRRNSIMTSADTPDNSPVIETWYVDPNTLKVNYYDSPKLIVE